MSTNREIVKKLKTSIYPIHIQMISKTEIVYIRAYKTDLVDWLKQYPDDCDYVLKEYQGIHYLDLVS